MQRKNTFFTFSCGKIRINFTTRSQFWHQFSKSKGDNGVVTADQPRRNVRLHANVNDLLDTS